MKEKKYKKIVNYYFKDTNELVYKDMAIFKFVDCPDVHPFFVMLFLIIVTILTFFFLIFVGIPFVLFNYKKKVYYEEIK